jgi:hypothetical protein
MAKYNREPIQQNNSKHAEWDSCIIQKRVEGSHSQYIDDMNETPTIFKWKYKMDKMTGGIVVDKDYGVLIC